MIPGTSVPGLAVVNYSKRLRHPIIYKLRIFASQQVVSAAPADAWSYVSSGQHRAGPLTAARCWPRRARGRIRMSEPGSMSLTATLVMATVVIILVVAWLAAVFWAARQPAGEARRRGRARPATAPAEADRTGSSRTDGSP